MAKPRRKRSIPSAVKREVKARSFGTCAKCNGWSDLQLSHTIAESAGGDETVGNLELLCRNCHQEWHFVDRWYSEFVSFSEWLNAPTFLTLLKGYSTGIPMTDEFWTMFLKMRQSMSELDMADAKSSGNTRHG